MEQKVQCRDGEVLCGTAATERMLLRRLHRNLHLASRGRNRPSFHFSETRPWSVHALTLRHAPSCCRGQGYSESVYRVRKSPCGLAGSPHPLARVARFPCRLKAPRAGFCLQALSVHLHSLALPDGVCLLYAATRDQVHRVDRPPQWRGGGRSAPASGLQAAQHLHDLHPQIWDCLPTRRLIFFSTWHICQDH
jgi:hypothetical protein